MTPQFLNMCLQIFDTTCMSGFTAGCFYHANQLYCLNGKPQKELALAE
jgi:hypothetical protein